MLTFDPYLWAPQKRGLDAGFTNNEVCQFQNVRDSGINLVGLWNVSSLKSIFCFTCAGAIWERNSRHNYRNRIVNRSLGLAAPVVMGMDMDKRPMTSRSRSPRRQCSSTSRGTEAMSSTCTISGIAPTSLTTASHDPMLPESRVVENVESIDSSGGMTLLDPPVDSSLQAAHHVANDPYLRGIYATDDWLRFDDMDVSLEPHGDEESGMADTCSPGPDEAAADPPSSEFELFYPPSPGIFSQSTSFDSRGLPTPDREAMYEDRSLTSNSTITWNGFSDEESTSASSGGSSDSSDSDDSSSSSDAIMASTESQYIVL